LIKGLILSNRVYFAFMIVTAPQIVMAGGGGGSGTGGAVIYVDSDATETDDDTSWADAFTDLQSAPDMATTGRNELL